MYISVVISALLCSCFALGGILIGFGITYCYYGHIAKDAEKAMKQNNKMWNGLLYENNQGWFEFYNDLIERECKYVGNHKHH